MIALTEPFPAMTAHVLKASRMRFPPRLSDPIKQGASIPLRTLHWTALPPGSGLMCSHVVREPSAA